jgi:hypothetical protein
MSDFNFHSVSLSAPLSIARYSRRFLVVMQKVGSKGWGGHVWVRLYAYKNPFQVPSEKPITPRLVTLTVGIPCNDIWLELLIGISYLLSKKLDKKKIRLKICRMSEYPVYQPYIIKNPAYKLWLWSCSYFRRLNLDQISENTRDLERTFQKLQSETNLDFLAQFV